MAIQAKNKLGYDDSLDAFGIHGIGGISRRHVPDFFIRPSWMEEAASSIWQMEHGQYGINLVFRLLLLLYCNSFRSCDDIHYNIFTE